MTASPPNYSTSEKWADVTPLPQDDGGPNALAVIAYSQEYREAMAYLRAVMATNDLSPRVLELTAHVILLNPAHYTVWLYRAKALFATGADLATELAWLDDVSFAHLKNYQIWHHRQLIMTQLAELGATQPPEGEATFLARMLDLDTKNYHVWSYRQWLVKKFELWEGWGEMEAVEAMLESDCRNNSAWNHRWFLVFGEDHFAAEEGKERRGSKLWEREVAYAKKQARFAPRNESAWNYLRGLMRWKSLGMGELKEFALTFGEESSFALDVLAEAYAQEGECENATKVLDLLATKCDPIRVNYWNYRKSLLPKPMATA